MPGCARGPSVRLSPGPRYANLIYNPDSTGVPVYEVGRSEWPATIASDLPTEEISYQEVIYDRQGRFGIIDDNYDRRFDSVRFGHIRR